jgi:hypothetical protein
VLAAHSEQVARQVRVVLERITTQPLEMQSHLVLVAVVVVKQALVLTAATAKPA